MMPGHYSIKDKKSEHGSAGALFCSVNTPNCEAKKLRLSSPKRLLRMDVVGAASCICQYKIQNTEDFTSSWNESVRDPAVFEITY